MLKRIAIPIALALFWVSPVSAEHPSDNERRTSEDSVDRKAYKLATKLERTAAILAERTERTTRHRSRLNAASRHAVFDFAQCADDFRGHFADPNWNARDARRDLKALRRSFERAESLVSQLHPNRKRDHSLHKAASLVEKLEQRTLRVAQRDRHDHQRDHRYDRNNRNDRRDRRKTAWRSGGWWGGFAWAH